MKDKKALIRTNKEVADSKVNQEMVTNNLEEVEVKEKMMIEDVIVTKRRLIDHQRLKKKKFLRLRLKRSSLVLTSMTF